MSRVLATTPLSQRQPLPRQLDPDRLPAHVAVIMESASTSSSIKEIIIQITKNRLGAVAIINEAQEVVGIVTDGDIRRMLEKHDDLNLLKALDIMNPNPKQITSESLAAEAFEQMRNNNINQLIVSDNNAFVGIIHIQDLIREGII